MCDTQVKPSGVSVMQFQGGNLGDARQYIMETETFNMLQANPQATEILPEQELQPLASDEVEEDGVMDADAESVTLDSLSKRSAEEASDEENMRPKRLKFEDRKT